MSSVFRIGVLVGLVCLVAISPGLAVAEDVDHEHPDEVDGNDDLEGVEQWLGNRLGERHVDCAEGIGIGSFDTCDDLGEDYRELLGQYATVENDLRSETDTAEQFNEARDQQQEYAALQEEFENTYEEYQAARAAGNDAEALQLARELQRLAARIEALGGDLVVNFVELDERTDADLDRASQTINESTAEVRTIVLDVEAESFETTEVTASVGENASFAAPATVTGHVRTVNGTGVGDAAVVLTDGSETVTTTSTANGSYELLYRPTRTRIGQTNLTVQYRPAPNDPYLDAEATHPINVSGTDSELHLDHTSNRAAFSRPLVVMGELRAATSPVPGMGVTIQTDNRTLTTAQTGPDGEFRAVTRIPVTVAPGAHTITIQASELNRAINVSRTFASVSVDQTATQLSIEGTANEETIEVSGRLRTAAGADVGRRQVKIQIGNETHEVRTEPDGSFAYSDGAPSDIDQINATATYEEANTNLGPSQAETTIEVDSDEAVTPATTPEQSDGNPVSTIGSSPLRWGIVGIALVIALFALIVLGLRFRVRSDTPPEESSPPTPATSTGEASDGPSQTTVESLIETARSKLETEPQMAVYASYAAVRSLLEPDPDQTHWELYEQQHSADDDRSDEAFHTLTEIFERAAFAAGTVDTKQAKSALEAAEQYLEPSDSAGSTD